MDPEQTNSIPLFLRRIGNGEKSSKRTMKLVFSGEESASGARTICPEIKVNDLPCAYTVSDMVLLSPTLNNQGFLMDMDVCEDEIHGRRLGSRMGKEGRSDDQRKVSKAMMSLPYSNLQQENKDPRNSSVDPSKKLLLPKNSEPVGNTTGGGCLNPMIWPLDEEEQPNVGDGRMTQIRMCPSPFYHPRASERTPNPFLRVFHSEGSPMSTSDSDSSANGSPSGFFKPRFRSSSVSNGGSVSGSSTSTTPGISPSGDFRELTWDDDPFTIKSKPPISPGTISNIENELKRSSLTDKVLTPIEIEAKKRYEQRVQRKKERERKREERFFF